MSLPANGGMALVTGAGSGIGRAFAVALDQAGCEVILVGRNEAALREVSAGLRHPAVVLVADLATSDGIEAIHQACPDRLDVLVHSAGVFHHGPISLVSRDAWAGLFGVNVGAPMLLTARCLPALRRAHGQVVVINSTAALSAGTGNAAYAATKQALKTATDALRQEVRGFDVRVLSVFPGRTDTAMQASVLASEGRVGAAIPLLAAKDVADAALYVLQTPRPLEITDLVIRPPNA